MTLDLPSCSTLTSDATLGMLELRERAAARAGGHRPRAFGHQGLPTAPAAAGSLVSLLVPTLFFWRRRRRGGVLARVARTKLQFVVADQESVIVSYELQR
jgi:hypothetical protein